MICSFCHEPEPTYSIHQTKYWNVILSYDQTYLGRCIVALKRHCDNLAELKKEEWEEFTELVRKLESAFKNSFKAAAFNWSCLMNDAYKKEVPAPHVHWHLRPRYKHNVSIAGLTFEDLEFGNHYNDDKKIEISNAARKIIVSKIKENLT